MSVTGSSETPPREGTRPMPAPGGGEERPRVGLVLGDPAGIGPELVARLLADPGARALARPVVVGERWVLEQGMEIARRSPDGGGAAAPAPPEPPPILEPGAVGEGEVTPGRPDGASGRAALTALERALGAVEAGELDGICFAPLNKQALNEAGMGAPDELHWLARRLRHDGVFGEINVLENLWTTRVTSHVPLARVAGLITRERVLAAIRLAHESLVDAGRVHPRIAVAGLNPHAGEGGLFGREEIDIIGPAVEDARKLGIEGSGPWPADTVFVRAKEGEWDAVSPCTTTRVRWR